MDALREKHDPLTVSVCLRQRENEALPKGGLFLKEGEEMASLAGLNGISLPSFGSSMDPEDARALRNYLYQLQEQLGYVLTNLDSENMSENFLNSKEKTE